MSSSSDRAPLTIVRHELGELIPDVANMRTHSEANIEAIKASLARWGQQKPIVIDAGRVVRCGNGTLEAARRLGWTHIDCVVSELGGAELAAFAIADNRTAELAGWSEELGKVVAGLKVELPDLDLPALSLDALPAMPSEPPQPTGPVVEPVEPPFERMGQLRASWGVSEGQLWLLSEIPRIVLGCGDSGDGAFVGKAIEGNLCDLVFTSPPYAHQRQYMHNGQVQDWFELMQRVFSELPTSDEAQVLVNLGLVHEDGEWVPYWDEWIEWMRNAGWRRFGWYVWDHINGLPGAWNGRCAPCHEFVFHFNQQAVLPTKTVAKKPTSGPMGSSMRGKDGVNKAPGSDCDDPVKIHDSVFRVDHRFPHGTDHPAVFPVQFASEVIACWPGRVYEPFAGACSALLACHFLKRECVGIEIVPEYVAVALERWQTATGIAPQRLS